MGTRNLTVVIDKAGTLKIAQYGQWDGYPSGQGKTALEFLLANPQFEKKLEKVRFQTESDTKEFEKFLKDIGSKDGSFNGKQYDAYKAKYALLSRDNGAGVLQMINDLEEDAWLENRIEFANDSLFCEWAYVIDYQKGTFEVYQGFNEKPLNESDRFYSETEGKYSGVKLLKSYSLDNLPSVEVFLAECKEE